MKEMILDDPTKNNETHFIQQYALCKKLKTEKLKSCGLFVSIEIDQFGV